MMPVLRRTRAMEAIQQRFGSRERNPHVSSRSNPLARCQTKQTKDQLKPMTTMAWARDDKGRMDEPHAQHINQMLLSNIVFPVNISLKSRKDTPSRQKGVPAIEFKAKQSLVW